MSATVLVVEDDAAISQLLTLQLEAEGFQVRTVGTGNDALGSAATALPSVVLLDVMLPDIDGWTVLRRLRALPATSSVPVIMLTSRAMPADEIRGWNLGATAYMTKPYEADELVAKIHQVLADARAE